MLSKRVIPCLLLENGGLVKTVKFKDGNYIGDPINAIKIFNEKEVDELIFIDIKASRNNTEPDYELIQDFASECFMPVAYGGGIKTMKQIEKILKIGIEKVVINTAAINNPEFIKEAAKIFGSSTIVGAIDVVANLFKKHFVYDHVNRKKLSLTPEEHALKLEELGVGEIFLNSVDKDGTYSGYDLPRIKSIASLVHIPLIVCGGASGLKDFKDAMDAGAGAVAAGSLFVYQGPHKAVLITYPSPEELERFV